MLKDLSYQALCERYYYLTDQYADKYGLDEDGKSQLAIQLCIGIQHYLDDGGIQTHLGTYIHGRLDREAARLRETQEEPVEYLEDLDITYELEDCAAYKDTLRREVSEVLTTLMPREERVLRMRFFQEMSLGECGEELGLTRTRVQQIEAKALRQLRHPSRAYRLVDSANVFLSSEVASRIMVAIARMRNFPCWEPVRQPSTATVRLVEEVEEVEEVELEEPVISEAEIQMTRATELTKELFDISKELSHRVQHGSQLYARLKDVSYIALCDRVTVITEELRRL